MQGPSPVHMCSVILFRAYILMCCWGGGGGGGGGGGRGLKTPVWWATITLWQQWDITT